MSAITIAKAKAVAATVGALLALGTGAGGGAVAVRLAAAEPGSPAAAPAPGGREPVGAVEPALAPDPAIAALLDGLGDNTAAELPPIKTVGEWNAVSRSFGMEKNGPSGRDYTNKAVWMPDRRRAFFCGANHGSPHRLNDAWEHDLTSNTWVMLFAPDPHNAAGVMEIAEGRLPVSGSQVKYVRTRRGGPTHYGHTWWGLAYDPGIKAALWMNVGIGSSAQAHVKKELGNDAGVYAGPPMWAFFPAEKRWALALTEPPYPRAPYAGAMEYVPELGGAFWYAACWSGAGMHVYQAEKGSWNNLKPNGGENLYHSKSAPRAEAVMCYDRANGLVVAQSSDRSTCHYDVKANTWRKVLDPGKDSDSSPVGHDARSVMFYDPGSRVCLLWSSHDQDKGAVWVHDAAVTPPAWKRVRPAGAEIPPGGRHIGYFDEARNVLVINRGARTWVYRHRRGKN